MSRIVCPKCGFELKDGEFHFCPKCGASIGTATETDALADSTIPDMPGVPSISDIPNMPENINNIVNIDVPSSDINIGQVNLKYRQLSKALGFGALGISVFNLFFSPITRLQIEIVSVPLYLITVAACIAGIILAKKYMKCNPEERGRKHTFIVLNIIPLIISVISIFMAMIFSAI